MSLQPRQIAKVVYEASRAYGGTIGEADKKHWEGTTQEERDSVLTRVDAALRGVPYQTGIAPSDQIKARLLTSIVDVFVQVYNPPIRYAVPAPPPIAVPDIPVEVFDNPDVTQVTSDAMDRMKANSEILAESLAASAATETAPVSTLDNSLAEITRANAEDGETPEAVNLTEALARADANIAKENDSAS